MVAVLTAVALATALVYAFSTPLWQAPDEPSHLGYVQFLLDRGTLPSPLTSRVPPAILQSAKASLGWPVISSPLPTKPGVLPAEAFAYRGLMYTANHPPLYYLVAKPFAQLGAALATKRVTGLAYGARFLSALLAALTAAVAYTTGRLVGLSPANSLLVGFLIVLQPQFMFIATSINNDSLAIFLFSLLIYFLLQEIRRPMGINPVICGTIIGLGLLTKITFFLAIPLMWWAYYLARHQTGKSLVWRRAALTTVLAVAISGWWFARNLLIYKSPWYVIGGTGLGQASTAEFFTLSPFYQWLFKSYWGYFGWVAKPLPGGFFAVLLTLAMVSALGLVVLVVQKNGDASSERRRILIFLISVPLTLLVGAAWFRIVAQTGQGRYLFPGIVPATLLLWIGLRVWAGDRYRSLAAHALLILFAIMTWSGLSIIRQL